MKKCNRTACGKAARPAYFNFSTQCFYCEECALRINKANHCRLCVREDEVALVSETERLALFTSTGKSEEVLSRVWGLVVSALGEREEDALLYAAIKRKHYDGAEVIDALLFALKILVADRKALIRIAQNLALSQSIKLMATSSPFLKHAKPIANDEVEKHFGKEDPIALARKRTRRFSDHGEEKIGPECFGGSDYD